ncbi:uncharacterized protein METZ01_LOCUS502594, partial [marine metagenome]
MPILHGTTADYPLDHAIDSFYLFLQEGITQNQ